MCCGRWRPGHDSFASSGCKSGVAAAAVTACGRVLTEVGISMMVGGNIKWHTRTVTTAIALETNKGQFGMGVALGIVLLAIAFMQILYQSNPFVRLTQPVVGARFATIPVGAASGWVIAASAAGSFLGALVGGFLANSLGFNAINWMAAIAVGLALLLLFISLWPAERRKRSEEAAAPASEPS